MSAPGKIKNPFPESRKRIISRWEFSLEAVAHGEEHLMTVVLHAGCTCDI